MVPEALTCKYKYDPMEKRNGRIKSKQMTENASLGWVPLGRGLDKGLAWNAWASSHLGPLGKNGHAGSQAGCEERQVLSRNSCQHLPPVLKVFKDFLVGQWLRDSHLLQGAYRI